MALLILLGTACLQISTTGFSDGGGSSTAGSIGRDGGGTTTGGGGGTTTGGGIGRLPPGAPCTSNLACGSGICGLAGTGNCCATTCTAGNAICGATGCDDAGACVYPAAGIDCGPLSCNGDLDVQPQCDGSGGCGPDTDVVVCPFGLECIDDGGVSVLPMSCESTCNSSGECAGSPICGAEDAACMRGYCNITFTGCGVSPELTNWNSLSYTAELPTGTDIQLDVRVTNSLDSRVISAAADYRVCDSLEHPANPATTCPRNPDGSNNLLYFNLAQGKYLTVFVTLIPSPCDGGSSPASVPTLNDLAVGQSCASN